MYAGQVYRYPPVPPPVSSLMAPRLPAHAQGIHLPPGCFNDGFTNLDKVGRRGTSASDRELSDRRKAESSFLRDVHLLSSLHPAARDPTLRMLQAESSAVPGLNKSLPYGYTRPGEGHHSLNGRLNLAAANLDFDALVHLPASQMPQASSNPTIPSYLMPYHTSTLPPFHSLPPSLLHNYYSLSRPELINLYHQQQQQQHQHLLALSSHLLPTAPPRPWPTEAGVLNPLQLLPAPHSLDYLPRSSIQSDSNQAFPPQSFYSSTSLQREHTQISPHGEGSTNKTSAVDKSRHLETKTSTRFKTQRLTASSDRNAKCERLKDCGLSHDPRLCNEQLPGESKHSKHQTLSGSGAPAISPNSSHRNSSTADDKSICRGSVDDDLERSEPRDYPVDKGLNSPIPASPPAPLSDRSTSRDAIAEASNKVDKSCDPVFLESPALARGDDTRPDKIFSLSALGADADRMHALPDSTLDSSRPPSQSSAAAPRVNSSCCLPRISRQTPSSSPPLSPTTTTNASAPASPPIPIMFSPNSPSSVCSTEATPVPTKGPSHETTPSPHGVAVYQPKEISTPSFLQEPNSDSSKTDPRCLDQKHQQHQHPPLPALPATPSSCSQQHPPHPPPRSSHTAVCQNSPSPTATPHRLYQSLPKDSTEFEAHPSSQAMPETGSGSVCDISGTACQGEDLTRGEHSHHHVHDVQRVRCVRNADSYAVAGEEDSTREKPKHVESAECRDCPCRSAELSPLGLSGGDDTRPSNSPPSGAGNVCFSSDIKRSRIIFGISVEEP